MTRSDHDFQAALTAGNFSVQRLEADDGVTLVLRGELDLASQAALVGAAERVSARSLTLDLTELSFIDSSGLRVLMNLDLRARREAWDFTIRRPQGQVLRLLRLCGFDQRLPIEDLPA